MRKMSVKKVNDKVKNNEISPKFKDIILFLKKIINILNLILTVIHQSIIILLLIDFLL